MNWTLVFFEQNDKQTLKQNILGIHFLLFCQSQLERPVGNQWEESELKSTDHVSLCCRSLYLLENESL